MTTHLNQTKIYNDWVQFVPITHTIEISPLTFPLNEAKTYVISSSRTSDLVLPSKLDDVIVWIVVDKNGTVEIKNMSTPVSTETISVSESEVKPNDKVEVDQNAIVKIGTYTFKVRRTESPSLSQLNGLLSNLQCSVCLRFFEDPRSLSCEHVFCEGCLTNLVQNLPSQEPVTPMNSPSSNSAPAPPPRNRQAKISCPVCRQTSPLVNGCPQKILSDVTKLFQEVIESRPNCAFCANKRWLVHGCEYYYCETCEIILCPLCALDFHRYHNLKNNFLNMYKASREFVKQTVSVKRDWAEIMKQVEESKENARKANQWIESMKSNLRQMETKANSLMTPSTTAYNTVLNLGGLRFDDKTEASREEAVKSLENEVNKVQDRMALMVADITSKVNILTDTLKKIKSVTAEEDNEFSKFESPASSISPPSSQ